MKTCIEMWQMSGETCDHNVWRQNDGSLSIAKNMRLKFSSSGLLLKSTGSDRNTRSGTKSSQTPSLNPNCRQELRKGVFLLPLVPLNVSLLFDMHEAQTS